MLTAYLNLVRQYWPMVCFGLLAIFAGNFGQSFFISWYGVEIQKSLGLSAATYGSAYSAATLLSGLSIMAIGGAIDKVALHKFITFVCAGLFCAALCMWQANSLAMLLLGFFLVRFCGQGLLPHSAMTAMGRYFSLNRGKAISFASNGVPLGEILLPSFAVLSISLLGWQTSWLLVAVLIPLLFLPLMHYLLRRAGPSEADKEKAEALKNKKVPTLGLEGSRRTLLKDGRFWRALPLLLAPPFIVTGLFIHQGFVLQEKAWSSALFATAFVVYGVTHWLGSMVTGALVDRYSAVKLLPSLGLPFIVGLYLGGFIDAAWGSFVMMACLGAGIGMASTIFNALWVEMYGAKHLGSIRSLTSSLIILSTSASPALLGFLIDHGLTGATMLYGMGFYALSASVLAVFSYRA